MNNEYKISGIILCGVVVALFLIPSFQADTIFLVNEQGGTPESCVGNNGLVLAQNITDLCDVTVITPLTNQILRYNGSQWINVNSTAISESTVCVNVGTGTAFSCVEGTNVNLRSLLAGTGISISNNSNTITITNTLPEATVCNNIGTGNAVIHVLGTNCTARSLIAGDGVEITNTVDDYTFTSSCDSTGTGEALCETGNDINSLIAGNSLTITDTTGDLTITPTLQKLCEATASGGETTLTCTLSSSQQILYFSFSFKMYALLI